MHVRENPTRKHRAMTTLTPLNPTTGLHYCECGSGDPYCQVTPTHLVLWRMKPTSTALQHQYLCEKAWSIARERIQPGGKDYRSFLHDLVVATAELNHLHSAK